jgi:hypothetical protein
MIAGVEARLNDGGGRARGWACRGTLREWKRVEGGLGLGLGLGGVVGGGGG